MIQLETKNSKRVAVQVNGLPLFALSFQALGIIYSDIGTSPLYVLTGIWHKDEPPPSKEDVIGGISAIIWSLTLLPLLQYVFIALYFGTNEGEGGSFALFQALYPPRDQNWDEDRTLSGECHVGRDTPVARTFKEKARWPLLLWCLFGTALTMADGIFTPAISVTGACTGITVAKPSFTSSDTTAISIVFLLALFVIQPFGTARVAVAYAPISFVWFLLLAITGIYNTTFFPGIFRAFDPSRAVMLFVRTKDYGLLAGILLALTGCEAMFANLGQFNALSIRLSFCVLVYPALIFAYLGQGARMIVDPTTVIMNPFYQTIPGPVNGPFYWIMLIFGVLASLVASQALITGTFSLVQQVIHSKALPPIRMVHTSETMQGQIYIPAFNWILMVATIAIVAIFSDLDNLSNAYGFAVATVIISSSVLVAIHIPFVKKFPIVLGIAYFLTFGFFDALFWGAALSKVRHGAWVPLLIGVVLVLIMLLWVWAKHLEDNFDGQNRMDLGNFIRPLRPHSDDDHGSSDGDYPQKYYCVQNPTGDSSENGTDEDQRTEIQRIPTLAIFHKLATGKGIPHTFVGFIRQWRALPRVVVFVSVCVVPLASIPVDERYVVNKDSTVEGFYGATYYIGYRDSFDVKSEDLVRRICDVERRLDPSVSGKLLGEIRAASKTTTHIASHYHIVAKKVDVGYISPVVNYIRTFLIEGLYRRLATIFPQTGNWLTPADEIIYVGVNAVI